MWHFNVPFHLGESFRGSEMKGRSQPLMESHVVLGMKDNLGQGKRVSPLSVLLVAAPEHNQYLTIQTENGIWTFRKGKVLKRVWRQMVTGVHMYLTVLLSVREVSGLNLGNDDCGISRVSSGPPDKWWGSRLNLDEVMTANFHTLLSASPTDPSFNAT